MASGQFHTLAEDDKATRVKKFFARNVILLIAAVIALVSLIAVNSTLSSRSETLDAQGSEILGLRAQADQVKKKVDTDYGEVLMAATGGVDPEHREADDETMRKLFTKALTWDGLKAYLDVREQVKREYKLDDASDFMRVYLPGEQEGVARRAPDGEMFYAFDKDMSSKFESITSYVTAVNGDVYSYWTIVRMRVFSDAGGSSSVGYTVATYDVVDNEPANIHASTMPQGITTSG